PRAQASAEKLVRRPIRAQPVSPEQEVMDLVREYELLDGNASLAQLVRERDRLGEGHVAIVVTVDEQHRGTPSGDRGERRRSIGGGRLRGVVQRVVGGQGVR